MAVREGFITAYEEYMDMHKTDARNERRVLS